METRSNGRSVEIGQAQKSAFEIVYCGLQTSFCSYILQRTVACATARMGDPYLQLYYTSTPGPCFQPSFQLPLALPTSVDEMDFQPPPIGSANSTYKLSKKSKKITKKRKKSCGLCRHHVKGKLYLHLYFILPTSLTNFSAKKISKALFVCTVVSWFILFNRDDSIQ